MPDSAPEVKLADQIRTHLAKDANIRAVLETKLTTTGEQIVLYDNGKWPLAPRPAIAVVTSQRTTGLLTLLATEAQYLGSCEFDLTKEQKGVAVAYQFAGDGSGTEFVVVTWQSGEYRVVLHEQVRQGRMVLGVGELKLWDSIGSAKCVWCPTRYSVLRYLWRNGRYIKASKKNTRPHDPEKISGSPLIFAKDESPPRARDTR